MAVTCRHFAQGCGGCTFQVPYAEQLALKAKAVRETLARGPLRRLLIRPIVPAPEEWRYRNKVELSFHADGVLGLHVRGAWDRVFTLEECHLVAPLAASIATLVRDQVRELGISRDAPGKHVGLLRQLVIRRSEEDRFLVALVTRSGPFHEATDLAARIMALDPRIAGVLRGVNDAPADRAPLARVEVLAGEDFIVERLAGLRFRIGLETFFQTNTRGAERLLAVVDELCAPGRGARALDLFCGVGTFALALARRCSWVTGIELVPASIEAARANARENGIANVDFHAGDVKPLIPEVAGSPALVLLDPPRGGAGGKVMRRIARLGAARIVYVSCNPRSLAQDLRELAPFGYRIAAVQPIDLFPQTDHVETVVALDARTGPTR